MRRRNAIAVSSFAAVGTLAGAIVVGSVPHARVHQHATPAEGVSAAPVAARSQTAQERFALHQLDRSSLRKRDEFVTPDGDTFTISEGQTKDGAKTCIVSIGKGFGTSACDANPFAHSTVLFGESFSAGPGGKDLTDWELSGLAALQVARLELIDSAGRHRPVHLGKGNAFFFALSRGEVKRGITAQSLRVFDGDGKLIDTVGL
ncbi:MAG: hypothetical protein WAQ33_16240 [Gaiellaceae bacterium]